MATEITVPTAPRPFGYLTVIPRRTPKQKAHYDLGHAKNAIRARCNWGRGTDCDTQVFELVDGDWKLLWNIPRGTLREDFPWNSK